MAKNELPNLWPRSAAQPLGTALWYTLKCGIFLRHDCERSAKQPSPQLSRLGRLTLAGCLSAAMNFIAVTILCILATAIASDPDVRTSSQQCASSTSSLHWESLTTDSVQAVELVVFPLGSVEAHGPHLPLGTDLYLAREISERSCEGLPRVALLPASPYGASFEHSSFNGTIPIEDSTINQYWHSVAHAVAQAGVRKIVFINAHGGQTANVDIAVRTARMQFDVLAAVVNLQAMMGEAFEQHFPEYANDELSYGIHGGMVETSAMLHLVPHLVNRSALRHFAERPQLADSGIYLHNRVVSYGWRIEDLSPYGAVGNASAASEHIGAAIVQSVVHRTRELLLHLQQSVDPYEVLAGAL